MLLNSIFKYNNQQKKIIIKERTQKTNKFEKYAVSQIIRAQITQATLKVSAKRIPNLIKVGKKVKVLLIQKLQK
jgi:hypothetical protein